MKRLAIFLAVPVLLFSFASPAEASQICGGVRCTAEEMGPFMKNISAACGNLGNCSMSDLEWVIDNVATFILGIVGSLVLLMYVLGGMYFLTSAGMPDRIAKGKQYIRISTIGLVIVFVSYTAITALVQLLKGTL